MSTEITPEDDGSYSPEPYLMHEDSCLIFDPVDFEIEFDCFAATYVGGALWVLDKSTRKWLNAERGSGHPKLKGVS